MTNLHTVRPILFLCQSFVCAAIIGVAGCGGGRTSSPAIPLDAANDSARAAALMARLDPAGVNVTGSGPWKSVSLGYTPNTLLSAALSANASVWFADSDAHIVGAITASGKATRYDAGSFVFPNPTGSPTVIAARPFDIEAGPKNTTYYLDPAYGYGVMSASGTPTLHPTYCQSNCVNTYLDSGEATALQMAVSSDGSAWFGAELYSPTAATPVIVRALGSAVSAIVVPGWSPCCGYPAVYNPAWLTTGPDGNVWFSDGQAIGKINVATNAVKMYKIPAQYTNTSAWAADIASGPDGALWVSYTGSYLLRISTSGAISGFLTPPSAASFNGDQSSHGITAGPNNTLYGANGEWLISSFNITTSQFSTYNWPNQGVGGGAQTITVGADSNMWVFQSNYSKAHVFFPHSTISSTPAALKMKVGTTATLKIKEGQYTGTFSSVSQGGCGAYATQSSSSGAFTVQAGAAGPPCFLSFSDTIGSGTVYVKVTVTP